MSIASLPTSIAASISKWYDRSPRTMRSRNAATGSSGSGGASVGGGPLTCGEPSGRDDADGPRAPDGVTDGLVEGLAAAPARADADADAPAPAPGRSVG